METVNLDKTITGKFYNTAYRASASSRWLSNGVRLRQREFYGHNPEPVQLEITTIRAEETALHLSAAEAMNGGSGFVRGLAREPQYIRSNGEVITNPKEMRCDCLSLLEYIERVYQNASCDVVAAISFGDLMTNEEYVAWIRDSRRSILFCRRSEEARMSRGYLYYALGVNQDGTPWAGRVRFKKTNGFFQVFDETGNDLTKQLHLVFTGPPLVWNSKPLNPSEAASRWVADIRHLLTLPACTLPTGSKMLLGESLLMSDAELLSSAVRGEAVPLPLTRDWRKDSPRLPFECIETLVTDALGRAYSLMPEPEAVQEVGQFAISDHKVVIRFRPGLYPHNLLGLDKFRTTWINLQIGGISTKSGGTLAEAANLMREAGAAYAIGLDQGADTQLLVRVGDSFYFKPSFIHRARVSAALVWIARQTTS